MCDFGCLSAKLSGSDRIFPTAIFKQNRIRFSRRHECTLRQDLARAIKTCTLFTACQKRDGPEILRLTNLMSRNSMKRDKPLQIVIGVTTQRVGGNRCGGPSGERRGGFRQRSFGSAALHLQFVLRLGAVTGKRISPLLGECPSFWRHRAIAAPTSLVSAVSAASSQ